MRKSESMKSHLSPAMSWKTRLTLFMGSAITDTAQRPDGTLNRRLLNVLDLKAYPTPHFFHHVRTYDVSVDPSRNLWFRVFTPTGREAEASLPLLVFFHGGGFAYLSPASKSYDAVCRRIARRLPAVIVSVNYRLSPEYRFPCHYTDGFDALKFLDGNSNALPEATDPSRCFLAGDSAGANLAHHVAVMACRGALRRVRVLGLVSIQPFFGGEERTEAERRLVGAPLVSVKRTDWLWRVFLPEGADRDHGAVNVSGPNAEDISGLEGFPETVVFVGGSDPLQDWQRRYGEWLRKSGKKADIIEYPNMIHAFYVFPELPESGQLIDQVRDFVNIRLSSL